MDKDSLPPGRAMSLIVFISIGLWAAILAIIMG
jgi:hypothetical protein